MKYHQAVYAQALDQYVTPGCSWLDVGSGTRLFGWAEGYSQDVIASRATVLVGCDPHGEHLAQNPYLTERHTCDASALPFAHSSFDLCTANTVLEHLTEPGPVFREVHRVLRPGGAFVAVTPHRLHPIIALAACIPPAARTWWGRVKEGRKPEHIFPTAYVANSRRAITKLAASAGLEVEVIETFQSTKPILPGWLGKIELFMGWHSNVLVVLRRPDVSGRIRSSQHL